MRQLATPREEFIYLIGADDVPKLTKIGWTTDIDKRLSALQIGSPVPLKVIGYWRGDRELEHWLHANFVVQNHRGEWFKLGSHDRAYDRVDHAIARYTQGDRRYNYQLSL